MQPRFFFFLFQSWKDILINLYIKYSKNHIEIIQFVKYALVEKKFEKSNTNSEIQNQIQ